MPELAIPFYLKEADGYTVTIHYDGSALRVAAVRMADGAVMTLEYRKGSALESRILHD